MHSSCNSLTAGSPPPLSLLRSMKPAICHQWTSHIHWSSPAHQPVFLILLSSFLALQLTGSAQTYMCVCVHKHTRCWSVFSNPRVQNTLSVSEAGASKQRMTAIQLQINCTYREVMKKHESPKYHGASLAAEELHLQGEVQSKPCSFWRSSYNELQNFFSLLACSARWDAESELCSLFSLLLPLRLIRTHSFLTPSPALCPAPPVVHFLTLVSSWPVFVQSP